MSWYVYRIDDMTTYRIKKHRNGLYYLQVKFFFFFWKDVTTKYLEPIKLHTNFTVAINHAYIILYKNSNGLKYYLDMKDYQ